MKFFSLKRNSQFLCCLFFQSGFYDLFLFKWYTKKYQKHGNHSVELSSSLQSSYLIQPLVHKIYTNDNKYCFCYDCTTCIWHSCEWSSFRCNVKFVDLYSHIQTLHQPTYFSFRLGSYLLQGCGKLEGLYLLSRIQ